MPPPRVPDRGTDALTQLRHSPAPTPEPTATPAETTDVGSPVAEASARARAARSPPARAVPRPLPADSLPPYSLPIAGTPPSTRLRGVRALNIHVFKVMERTAAPRIKLY